MYSPPYDDSIKASALAMLETAGYPSQRDALTGVSRVTGISTTTLRRWISALPDGHPLARPTGVDPLPLPKAIRVELLATLGSIAAARPEASYKELTAGFAVLAEKLKALDAPDAPTEVGPGDAKERLARLVGMGNRQAED